MICDAFDVVEVPFPFSDLPRSKRRKALVVSEEEFNRKNGNSILMMITSATHSAWHLDVRIENWHQSGLKKPCVARLKLFTLDNELILGKAGKLTSEDRQKVVQALKATLPV